MIISLPIDFLIRIKNGYKAGRKTITGPASKYCVAIADLLKKHGLISGYSVSDDAKKIITINLAYNNNEPAISDVKIHSRPGRRVYEKSISLPWGKGKQSLFIISTSSGVFSQKEAKSKGLGGEILAEIN
ncbi:MAG: 30S ribosomal protein S8 [Candidatus Shapirobacteria bacterium]|jgi:small subunit ribosomal protein S8